MGENDYSLDLINYVTQFVYLHSWYFARHFHMLTIRCTYITERREEHVLLPFLSGYEKYESWHGNKSRARSCDILHCAGESTFWFPDCFLKHKPRHKTSDILHCGIHMFLSYAWSVFMKSYDLVAFSEDYIRQSLFVLCRNEVVSVSTSTCISLKQTERNLTEFGTEHVHQTLLVKLDSDSYESNINQKFINVL
jgi:hypothetical protein